LEHHLEQFIQDIYLEYSREIYKYVLHKTKDDERAKDIVQQVFLYAAIKAEQLENHPNKIGWLYTTAGNVVKKSINNNYVRKTSKECARKIEFVPMDKAPEEKLAFEEKFYEGDVFESLDLKRNLSGKEYNFLKYRYMDDLQLKDISEKMGMSETATTTFSGRLKNKLKKILK